MKVYASLIIVTFLLIPAVSFSAKACKDIIVTGDATSGDFNLLMKVRDPSRPGPQVLCMINKGYSYSYHFPDIKGREKEFVVEHKFIGVVTKGDSPPNIVKAGIALSDAGLAYGDADSPSYWINPLKTAWDDFDWIRYACQSADNEDEAISLLKEVVEMHAPGVSENMFVVGPRKAYVLEGDALRYSVREVKGILVMSNYPKDLWRYRLIKRLFVARSFGYENEKFLRRGRVIRLGAFLGVKLLDVSKEGAYVKLWPVGERVYIPLGEGRLVDPFWVEILELRGNSARIRICYKYKMWEETILNMLKEKYGRIDVRDLMNLSRLHVEDLKGIRGMCERYNKATAICKIPYKDYEYLSCLWFAPDQCSSIYVPIHICCKEIYDCYENGDSAEIAKKILFAFGHGGFSSYASRVENVFIKEVELAEKIAKDLISKGKDPSDFLTKVDLEMQKQAHLTELFVLSMKEKGGSIPVIWGKDYSSTMLKLLSLSDDLHGESARIVGEIAKSIAKLKFEIFRISGNLSENRLRCFESGMKKIDEKDFRNGILQLYKFLSGEAKDVSQPVNEENYITIILVLLIILMLSAIIIIRIKG